MDFNECNPKKMNEKRVYGGENYVCIHVYNFFYHLIKVCSNSNQTKRENGQITQENVNE